MNKKFSLVFTLLFSCFYSFAQQSEAPKGVAVDPATMSFNLAAGQTGISKIRISNYLTEKKSFNVVLMDWMRDSTGSHVTAPPGTLPRSCSKWITIDKSLIELGPGQTEEVTVKMQVPDSANAAKEMKWCMIVFSGVVEKVLAKDTLKVHVGIQPQLMMGVNIYQTPPTVTDKGVKMLSFTKVPNEKGHYRVLCKNTGNTQIDVKSYLELTNLKNAKNKIKIGPKKFPLFPDQRRVVDFMLPDTLSKGKYFIIAAVDGGSDLPLEASQATIEIK